jgi:hypothetical protein
MVGGGMSIASPSPFPWPQPLQARSPQGELSPSSFSYGGGLGVVPDTASSSPQKASPESLQPRHELIQQLCDKWYFETFLPSMLGTLEWLQKDPVVPKERLEQGLALERKWVDERTNCERTPVAVTALPGEAPPKPSSRVVAVLVPSKEDVDLSEVMVTTPLPAEAYDSQIFPAPYHTRMKLAVLREDVAISAGIAALCKQLQDDQVVARATANLSVDAQPKVLLRPLLAIAAAWEHAWKPQKLKAEAIPFNIICLFCSAFVPPGKEILKGLLAPPAPPFTSWEDMLSRKGGLWSYLRFGSLQPAASEYKSNLVGTLQQRARAAFLQSMEIQHQMFARCNLTELGEIKTAVQSFSATVEVQTMTLFRNDSFWTWRDLFEAEKKRAVKHHKEKGYTDKVLDELAIESLLPSKWGLKNSVHESKQYESAPCAWAIRSKFNKVVIGGGKEQESISNSMSLNTETCGHLPGQAEGYLSFQGIELGLLLSRLVPEMAGDPWNEKGRSELLAQYTHVLNTHTFSSTFDCQLSLHSFPADVQQLNIDISSEFLFTFSRFLHHQNTAYDTATSA